MNHIVTRYLILSQLSLFSFLIMCTIITPDFLFKHHEGGASNYGVHSTTVVPYTLAFLLCSIFIVRAAHLLANVARLKLFRYALYVLACLFLLVLVSTYPYKLNGFLDNVHIGTAIVLFYFETGMAIWIALVLLKDLLSKALLIIEIIGFLTASFSLGGAAHILFIGQVITAVSFGALLVRAGHYLDY
jgi:hypothetical protein